MSLTLFILNVNELKARMNTSENLATIIARGILDALQSRKSPSSIHVVVAVDTAWGEGYYVLGSDLTLL